MGARVLACAFAFWVGGCLYPEYGIRRDGGTAGAGGPGNGGARGAAGRGGSTIGGSGGATSGTGIAAGGGGGITLAGDGGTTGGSTAGRGGSGGGAGRGGAGGTAGTGRGGGSAGTGGGGAGGGGAGRGGGSGGTGGGSAGRGGAGGAAGAGGTTVPPSWVPSISVVYLFDGSSGSFGQEAHGNTSLNLQPAGVGTVVPVPDPNVAVEGTGARLSGSETEPSYFTVANGLPLPSVFQTEMNDSFTTGGWFHITSTGQTQWLMHDEGATNFDQGGFVFFVNQAYDTLQDGLAWATFRVTRQLSTSDYMELTSTQDLGFDPAVPQSGWIHLVARFDGPARQLSIFAGGVGKGFLTDMNTTFHHVKSGPGPFMLGCSKLESCAFIGTMDEVFFTRGALDDAHVRRIYACGIDGARCRCSGASYASCGFLQSAGCANLPACDSPQ